MNKCTVTNKRILEFYQKNPSINFESVNLIFIDLFESLFKDMNQATYNAMNAQILQSVNDLHDSVVQLKQDIPSTFSLKLMESKQEYFRELQVIMQNSSNQTKEYVQQSISQSTETLVDKTKLTMSELLPKNHESMSKEITLCLNQFEKAISEEITKQNPENRTSNVQTLLSQFETKFNGLLLNVTNASETRLNDTMNVEKHIQNSFRKEMTQIVTDISKQVQSQNDFFDKYKNSSYKGAYSENNMEHVLSTLFQSAEIVNTAKETASGDFILRREDFSPILFENKDYTRNVPLEEVKKFVRDIETQQCHGIFLSQHSGITAKQHFEIETKGHNVLIYIHNVNYCAQTVKTAIDIIDSLSDKIIELSRDDTQDCTLPKDTLEEINCEVRVFMEKRHGLLALVKDFNGKMEKEIQNLELPSLCKFISHKFGNIAHNKSVIICDICNKFEAHSNKSLAAHKRKCGKKIST